MANNRRNGEKARKVTITTHLQGAQEVVLTGDFTDWSKDRVRMTKADEDEWSAILSLPPGEYQYRLLVDGQWKDHAEAPKRIQNAFGSENCVLAVS